MINEDRERNDMKMARTKANMSIGIGALYIILGVGVLYKKYFGSSSLTQWQAYGLGILLLAYGGFRIARALRQKSAIVQ